LPLKELDRATAIPGLNRDDAYQLQVPLLPLAEQRQIVARLDHLLARTARAAADVHRIPILIARYRESLLAAAFSGELTREWRERTPCTAAFDHLNDVRGQRARAALSPRRRRALSGLSQPDVSLPGIPQSWTWICIEELASDESWSIQSGPFGSTLLHSEFQDEGYLVIGIDNVHDGIFSTGSQNRISASKFSELERYIARPLDVLITVMATVGRTCVVPENIEPALITKHVYRISVDERLVSPYYLMNSLRGSEAVLKQMGANIRGHTRPGINGEILKHLFVPVAPLQEQHEILRRLSFNFAWLQGMSTEFTRAAHLLPKFDRAILAKAFRGELVPQDPSDEPASELLARIRAARSEQPNGRRLRKLRHDITPRAPAREPR